ncbi:DinB family protein [Tautonia plasticadhaerens]|uniref:DinB superfamily protein n=1 Tax=Tautonia plasticadhaerens TaxID=2527974 RepID=A0A518HCD1_9BACT|nr:DinB family protein [Tautonia plasticadhaerens]QDV38518.1 DinB superfamily protein [Tautonia plasticadhaerens]
MNATDVIRSTIDMSAMFVDTYLKDLSDADLLIRPVEGMNHIAWQLGHLIGSERHFVELIKPGTSPALPPGFQEAHAKGTHAEDDPSKFYPRERYQELWGAQRRATLALLESLSDEDLDRTDETFPSFAPTVGAIMNMVGSHPIMHVGQFVAVRRKLGKPITI